MNRRTLLRATALFGVGALAARCASTGPVTPASVAQDITLLAQSLAGALVSLPAGTPTVPPAVQTALADLQTIATAIGSADTIAAAQPLVTRVEADVNAVVAAVASIPGPLQIWASAALVLLPVLESAVNLVAPVAGAEANATTPDAARAALRALVK